MSKSTELLKTLFLFDADENPARVIGFRGAECGLDYLELSTQSASEKESGIKTVHRIYSGEVEISKEETPDVLQPAQS